MDLLRHLAFVTIGLVCLIAKPALAEERFALVIGNQAYAHLEPLKNPSADAKLVAASLGEIGFQVDLVEDAGKAQFDAALREFSAKVTPGSVVMVYYAGHGIQNRGENFLLPVDAEIRESDDLQVAALSARQLLETFRASQAQAVILVLDACRNSPIDLVDSTVTAPEAELALFAPVGGGATRGLALITADQLGTLLAFSTSPGSASFDGDGTNSPYSQALAATLKEPGLSIEDVFKQTRSLVVKTTAGQQVPWENSSLTNSIVLNPRPDQPSVTVATPCDMAAAHPSDPARVGPSVEYANLDPQIAVPACERAVADFPDVVRFKTLLARAYDKAGRGEEAAALNQIAMAEGSLAGYHNMGNLYRKGLGVPQDMAKAFELFLYAAERGHPEDQHNIAFMYEKGDGIAKDLTQARYWYEQAAAQNWAEAINRLGLMDLNGTTGPVDVDKAFEEFQRSADLGSRNAMVNVGNAYRKGLGAKKDPKRAIQYYENSARLGTRAAYMFLGQMYKDGETGEKDLVRAAFWLTLAARDANEQALEYLKAVKKKLTAEQEEDVLEMIEDWDTKRFG